MSSNANSDDVVLIRLRFVWRYKQGLFLDLFQASLNANARSFALTLPSFIKCITQLGKKTHLILLKAILLIWNSVRPLLQEQFSTDWSEETCRLQQMGQLSRIWIQYWPRHWDVSHLSWLSLYLTYKSWAPSQQTSFPLCFPTCCSSSHQVQPGVLFSPPLGWGHNFHSGITLNLLYIKTINLRACFAQIFSLAAVWLFYPLFLHSPLYKCYLDEIIIIFLVFLSIWEHLIYLQNIKASIKYSAILTVQEKLYIKIREQSFRHCNSLTVTQSYDLPQLRTWLTIYNNNWPLD